jgi:hypothetical protein
VIAELSDAVPLRLMLALDVAKVDPEVGEVKVIVGEFGT